MKPCVLEPGLHALRALARDNVLPRMLQDLTIEMKEGRLCSNPQPLAVCLAGGPLEGQTQGQLGTIGGPTGLGLLRGIGSYRP